ncbi:T9SS type A sorting domain-containing protein [Hymenobacter cellulosilyticus]|uniref:T9SS type A sorting domain-containing protein n=1 Tax=Hymenobacter cellulosilyticus TaxID=2932248 RepID=A0A8T9QC87_9BACT|nr:T9SS type A sorting domain-containing protein [Hymenobacter cellulosilyticus]UOQ74815.1 T9SS type A sorting domain-containing protein [Hymenobacter cellulosilyticus]
MRLADGFSSAEKFLTLSSKARQSSVGLTTGTDVSQVVGAALGRLAPGDSTVVAFAVLGAPTLPALQAAAEAAGRRYRLLLPTRRAVPAVLWQAYPNPAHTKLQLEVPAGLGLHTLRLFTSVGQLVRQQAIAGTRPELDVRTLPAGIYLLQVQGPAQVLSRQIVVE